MKKIIFIAIIVLLGGITYVYFGSQEISQPNNIDSQPEVTNIDSVVPSPEFEDVPKIMVNEETNVHEPEVELPYSELYTNEPVYVMDVESVTWNNTQNGWEPSATPPTCAEPLILQTPIDISLATSVLYPGQYRGSEYKPHGGFRFDTSKSNEITVTAPMDARVVDGGRYLVDGEIQYLFDFITPCGIWYRFGHLRTLSPKFMAIAETFPEAVEGDSRTYGVNTETVIAGETIALAVGLAEDNNVFVDWGVYDLRSKNSASENSSWATEHPGDQEQHAVCWFNLLSTIDENIVRNLPPADGVSGATSDYCL